MKKQKNLSCSEVTKNKIADALKELMKTEDFDKITISNITDKCKIHRQTFYYHFQDRYELLDWIIYKDLIEDLITDFSANTLCEKMYNVFVTIKENKDFYQSAFNIGIAGMSKYISDVSRIEFSKVITQIRNNNDVETTEEDDLMTAEFFGFGLGGLVISWAKRGMKETPLEMTRRIENFLKSAKFLITN